MEQLSKREKILIAIIVALAIALLVCISELMGGSTKTTTDDSASQITNTTDETSQAVADSQAISEDEMGEFINITMDEYNTIKSGSVRSVIYIARPTCSFCQYQDPITRYIIKKYDLKVYYLNTDELGAIEQNDLINSSDVFADGVSTPTTLIVENGEVIASAIGLNTLENYTNFFKNYELIK